MQPQFPSWIIVTFGGDLIGAILSGALCPALLAVVSELLIYLVIPGTQGKIAEETDSNPPPQEKSR